MSEAPRLFRPEELAFRPTGEARLRRMARLQPRAATATERSRDEERQTIERLRRQGLELSRRFRLRAWVLEAERQGVNGHYGICYEDGTIRIRLRHARSGRLLKESSLVDTLCHELAHLRHLNHGAGFRTLYQRILAAARELGYYRPGSSGPRQGRLFDGSGCGNDTTV